MKLSMLHMLFTNSISPDEFKSNISKEIYLYDQKLKTKGTSIDIRVEEDFSLYFGWSSLIKLCDLYIDHFFTSTEISYIADCLTLSEAVHYENKELKEILEEIIEMEMLGKLDVERIQSIIKRSG